MLTATKAEKGHTDITLIAETGHCFGWERMEVVRKYFWFLPKIVSVLDYLPFCVCKNTYITSNLYVILLLKWTWDDIFVKISRNYVKFSQPQCYPRLHASNKVRPERAVSERVDPPSDLERDGQRRRVSEATWKVGVLHLWRQHWYPSPRRATQVEFLLCRDFVFRKWQKRHFNFQILTIA